MPITSVAKNEPYRARLRAGVLALAFVIVATGQAAELTEQQQRGKHIYMSGESTSGAPITAVVAQGTVPISAAFLPCGGCHGEDGLGRPEGGVIPPDITWESLSLPLGHRHDYGRSHAAFDEHAIATATIGGVDPDGNPLDPAMPRFSMSESDMADLVAYLKVIAQDLDPGIGEDTIRVGTLLPVEGRVADMGDAMRRVIEAYFADINESGGIFGRRLELVAGAYVADPLQATWNARDFVAQNEVFALVSGYVAGIENEIAALAEESELPVVGPFTPTPAMGHAGHRYSFYLLGGIVEQTRALAAHVSGRDSDRGRKVAVVHPRAEIYELAADAATAELDAAPERLSYEPQTFDVVDVAQSLAAAAVTDVLFLGRAADLERLARAALEIGSTPTLLLPGVFANKQLFEIPSNYPESVLVGYSSIPQDHTLTGIAEFERLHARHSLKYDYSAAQISAFVAAKVLVEGLKRVGREPSRERFVDALEALSDFEPGLMPPLSYNSARRIGALGAYIVGVNLADGTFGTPSAWMDLQQ